jgi:hypothetical protein
MNCREYLPLLVEAARAAGRSAENAAAGPSKRSELDAALDHAASCPACFERLAEERSVSAGLLLLASAEASREPSQGCGATLLAAYRAERGREVHARRWLFAISGALAASLIVLVGAALLLSHESSTLARSFYSRLSPLAAHPETSGRPAPSVTPAAGLQSSADEESYDADSAAPEQEEVTDFVAYYPGADLSSLDSGALVRVRVPASALGSFGVQAAQGSEEEWVNADLLVAEDGSPQAIRFVRAVSGNSRN